MCSLPMATSYYCVKQNFGGADKYKSYELDLRQKDENMSYLVGRKGSTDYPERTHCIRSYQNTLVKLCFVKPTKVW